MSSCEQARPAPFRCPTPREVLESILALLPRGRAWQTTEGGPFPGLVRSFAPNAFAENAFATASRPPSVLMQFWRSIAAVVAFVNSRGCDLRMEFWCATHKETHDLWMAEYGLPDLCDPFPDLCTKVAAIGGTRCEYYAAVAARAGWSISCEDDGESCGFLPGAGSAVAGDVMPGTVVSKSRLRIFVDLDASTAYTGGPLQTKPEAGCFTAGNALTCDDNADSIDLMPLECLLARIVHAEIEIVYEVF